MIARAPGIGPERISTMATPFIGKTFTFTQPDGSTLEVRGDQHYAVFETLDGYTVTRNPATGFYEVAQLSSDSTTLEPLPGARTRPDDGRSAVARGLRVSPASARAAGREGAMRLGGRRCDERRIERRQLQRAMRAMAAAGGPMLAPPQRTTLGDYVGLCLLIDFPDMPATIGRDEVERFCNQVGYNGFGNSGSVQDYFLAQSLERCRYTNIVAPCYRARFPKTHYTNPNIPMGQRARELIREALDHHKAQGFDFSTLTSDGAGMVYAMNVYYSGPVVNNQSEGLWPHAWMMGTPVPLAAGKSAFDYQFTAMDSALELGTFCHENGHMLCDYPDLYDYGGESGGVGYYCLMCAGNHADPKNAFVDFFAEGQMNEAVDIFGLSDCRTVGLSDCRTVGRVFDDSFLELTSHQLRGCISVPRKRCLFRKIGGAIGVIMAAKKLVSVPAHDFGRARPSAFEKFHNSKRDTHFRQLPEPNSL
jgi:M6 family metalloprotease-like protein